MFLYSFTAEVILGLLEGVPELASKSQREGQEDQGTSNSLSGPPNSFSFPVPPGLPCSVQIPRGMKQSSGPLPFHTPFHRYETVGGRPVS
jgi:hypothetical protein